MARPLRIEYPGAVYHVTSRGNARQPIFKDDQDRDRFLWTLGQVVDRFHWLCHAYCLMNNHYHLVVETPEGNLAKGLRQLNGVYTQSHNRRHDRSGHLFQGRYAAILVQKERHLLEVCRYVVLNPIRARLIRRPEQWKWSSYAGTAGLGKPHACLTCYWIVDHFGTKRRAAEQRYRDFVREGRGTESIWNQVKGQTLLGEQGFVRRLIGHVRGREEVKEIPRSQRFAARPSLAKLLTEKVRSEKAGRDRRIVEAVARYGYSQKEVAGFLEMHYSTISRLVNREDQPTSKFKT